MTGVLIGRGDQNTEIPSDAESSALCTGAELHPGDSVWGEGKQNRCIVLTGRGGYSGLVPLHTDCPNAGEFGKELYSNGSRARLLIRIRVCAGPASFHRASQVVS